MAYNAAFEVRIVKVANGYQFRFSGKQGLIDADGNWNFSIAPAVGNEVHMSFTIADNSDGNFMFVEDPKDAMWIHRKPNVGEICPTKRYGGAQFKKFTLSSDRKTLSLVNANDDGVLYRYALRFVDAAGNRLDCDPDGGNGSGG